MFSLLLLALRLPDSGDSKHKQLEVISINPNPDGNVAL